MNISQADLGTAAAKLGGNVLSGMRSLGGMAFSAAKAGIASAAAAAAESNTVKAAGASASSGFSGMFSRSAPAAPGSDTAHIPQDTTAARGGLPSFTLPLPVQSTGCNLTVFDLRPLMSLGACPDKVADFLASKAQCVSNLRFSGDGTSLAVCTQDGHSARIYQLKPTPRSSRSSYTAGDAHQPFKDDNHPSSRSRMPSRTEGETPLTAPWHLYSLRRGRTHAVVDGLDWANDGRWFAMGTRKRTIHMFAVNPTGGIPDEASHIGGRVHDSPSQVSDIWTTGNNIFAHVSCHQPALSVEMHPITRLRADKTASQDTPAPALTFTFIRSSESTLPSNLLPLASVPFSASSSPSSVHSLAPVSPGRQQRRPTNYQDVLIFDPVEATLTLRRVFVDRVTEDQPSGLLAGASSMSLPGPSSLARLGAASSHISKNKSALSQMMEKPTHLSAHESRVGSWNLRRSADWPEVKQVLYSNRCAYPSQRPQRAE